MSHVLRNLALGEQVLSLNSIVASHSCLVVVAIKVACLEWFLMVIAGLEEIKALDNTLAATILHVWYKSTLSLASETKTRIRCSS